MTVSDMLTSMRPALRFIRVMINYTLLRHLPPPAHPPPPCYLGDHCCLVPAGQGSTDEKDLSHTVISRLWAERFQSRWDRENIAVIGRGTAEIRHKF